jgi:HK97 family phage portal protein
VSLLFRSANIMGPYPGYWGEFVGATAADIIPYRWPMQQVLPGHMVNDQSSMRHSAVWACLRLRANLISTFPLEVFRAGEGDIPQIKVAAPPVILRPGGDQADYLEWMYSTQFDLDRAGNTVGVIRSFNGYGLPAEIELVPLSWVSVRTIDNKIIKWFIRGQEYDPRYIWHEKQYTVAGFPLGLSPIMYAAWSISEGLSIQDFAISWFTLGGIPRGHLKNTVQPTVSNDQAAGIKARLKESVQSGDALVTGKDWDYALISPEQTGMEWIEARRLTPIEIARFFDVPADLIDSAVSGQAVTYANVTQRNLQFLSMSLGPAMTRRENALNKLLPARQFVKMNFEGLLRSDPKTFTEMLNAQVGGRLLTPDEARYMLDREPLTEKQKAEFDRFWPPKAAPVTPQITPKPGSPAGAGAAGGEGDDG